MALYAGLDPQAALAKWYAIRQKPADQLTPEEKTDIEGNMVGLSEENPAAWKTVATGINDNGKTVQVFDPMSGQWKEQEKKGYWSHPESWLQLAAAGSVAAPFIIPALAGIGGGSAASSAAAPISSGSGLAGLAPTTGIGPLAGGLTGATTSAATPSGIAAGSVSAGSKLAGMLGAAGKIGGTLSNTGVDESGNPINAPQTSAAAGQAQAFTNNRFLQVPIDQQGVNADAQAQRNMLRAGLIARMDSNAAPLSVGRYALPSLAPSAQGVDFSNTMQNRLGERMKAGKSLTLSGVPDPSQEELDAQKAAMEASGTGSGVMSGLTKAGNVVNQGVRLANLGKGVYDIAKGWWS